MSVSSTQILAAARSPRASIAGGATRAAITAISAASVVFVHESIHLAAGRLAGIPATFTGLSSVGIPHADVTLYAGWRLALMNGAAPLFTVLAGFTALGILSNWRNLPERLRIFLAWWAIFGIPYLGLQLMILVLPVDFSGNGADSAAVAGYLHAPPWVLGVLSFAGFLYYLWSGRLVARTMQVADHTGPMDAMKAGAATWRRVVAWLFVAVACAGAMRFAALALGFGGGALGVLAVCAGWSIACSWQTRWRSPGGRAAWSGWLVPSVIGLVALIPLGFLGGGNDFAQLWLLELPPVFAATMLLSRQALRQTKQSIDVTQHRRAASQP